MGPREKGALSESTQALSEVVSSLTKSSNINLAKLKGSLGETLDDSVTMQTESRGESSLKIIGYEVWFAKWGGGYC